MNDSLNNTLSGKQNRFRSTVASSRKKKAHALVPRISVKSKTIAKGEAYSLQQQTRKRKLSKKAKGLSQKPRHTFNPMRSNKKLSNKDKRKANKSLWNSTHNSKSIKKHLDLSNDMSDGEDDSEESDDSGMNILNKS